MSIPSPFIPPTAIFSPSALPLPFQLGSLASFRHIFFTSLISISSLCPTLFSHLYAPRTAFIRSQLRLTLRQSQLSGACPTRRRCVGVLGFSWRLRQLQIPCGLLSFSCSCRARLPRRAALLFSAGFPAGCRTFSPERSRRACGFQGAGFASPRGAPRPAITQKKRAAPKSGSFAFLSQLTERSSKFSFPSSPAACAYCRSGSCWSASR
jgi:hypothetical protein